MAQITHLKDEEIGRLIDGNLEKSEREEFLKHMSQCESCLSIYSQTLKFLEDDKKNSVEVKPPVFGESPLLNFWKAVQGIVSQKKYRFAGVALLILIIGIPLFIKLFSPASSENDRVLYIERVSDELFNRGICTFTGADNPYYSSVRAGIFVEDISVLINISDKKDLRKMLVDLLNKELIILGGEQSTLVRSADDLETHSYKPYLRNIKYFLEKCPEKDLFRFGGILERSILDIVNGSRNFKDDITRYISIFDQNYKGKVPQGVLKDLKKLNSNVPVTRVKEILIGIKQVYIAYY